MKKNTTEMIIAIVLLIPFIVALVYWKQLPDRMAIHFNFHGNPDNYGNKPLGLLLLPLVNLFMYGVLKFIPRLMPASDRMAIPAARFAIIRLVLHGFLTALYLLIVMFTLHHNVNILLCIGYGISVVMLVTGNYLNNIKTNHFVGIRTRWTMKNPEVWKRTHHFAARFYVITSLVLMCLLPFLTDLQVSILLLTYIVAISVIPVSWSWFIAKKINTL